MVHYSRSSLLIQVSHAKYIHFIPSFSTSSNPFTLQIRAIYKINRILLISLQIFAKVFVSNILIDISPVVGAKTYPNLEKISSKLKFGRVTQNYVQNYHRKALMFLTWGTAIIHNGCQLPQPEKLMSPNIDMLYIILWHF